MTGSANMTTITIRMLMGRKHNIDAQFLKERHEYFSYIRDSFLPFRPLMNAVLQDIFMNQHNEMHWAIIKG